jgi:hypothetical protein
MELEDIMYCLPNMGRATLLSSVCTQPSRLPPTTACCIVFVVVQGSGNRFNPEDSTSFRQSPMSTTLQWPFEISTSHTRVPSHLLWMRGNSAYEAYSHTRMSELLDVRFSASKFSTESSEKLPNWLAGYQVNKFLSITFAASDSFPC